MLQQNLAERTRARSSWESHGLPASFCRTNRLLQQAWLARRRKCHSATRPGRARALLRFDPEGKGKTRLRLGVGLQGGERHALIPHRAVIAIAGLGGGRRGGVPQMACRVWCGADRLEARILV